jgi:hypothetical protein
MATKRRFEQQEAGIDHASILRLIEERPAFLGAPELEALLTRSQTAESLEKAGFPVSSKTLATKASRGGGPPYSLFGPRPLYSWRDALIWAHSRLTSPRRSSSEGDWARDMGREASFSQWWFRIPKVKHRSLIHRLTQSATNIRSRPLAERAGDDRDHHCSLARL